MLSGMFYAFCQCVFGLSRDLMHSFKLHYVHSLDYCPHLCRHVYHNVSAVVDSGLLCVV